MKNILTTFILLFSIICLSQDTNKRPPQHHPTEIEIKKEVEKMGVEVGLNNIQKEEIVKINLDHVKEVKQMIEKKMTPEETIHDKIHLLRKKMDAKIMTLLDNQQKKKFQEYLERTKPIR